MEKTNLRMVDVFNLIETLQMLYDKGVNYVDISGGQGDDQDLITFSFSKDYIDEEYLPEFIKEFGDSENLPIEDRKFTDKDINDLL